MGRIDYAAILRGTRSVLDADPNIRQLRATVEIARAVLTVAVTPHVNIFEDRRDLGTQPIAAGTKQRFVFKWQAVVSAYSAAGCEDAMAQRDELLGYVETALMGNRSLGGVLTSNQLQLLGGDLQSHPGDNGFWSQGALELAAEVTATV